ncbi:uncharacterized protein LOC109803724 [Cajanus cajan]|uniref:uncharacterized protein LOC109803724 n=1 Tax=Cajanus cajan TaxID=3821 RepID=UPI00098DCC76|nr:uncharacterized protein LOC109803724 [Cajanus cajan]
MLAASGFFTKCLRTFQIKPLECFHQAVFVTIHKGLPSFVCTAIYASLVPHNREALWSYLREIRIRISTPWLLIGDYNEVLSPNEVRGGSFSLRRADRLLDTMEACHLLDMGSSGYKYTWYRGHTHTRTAKKLDRGLCDDSWRLLFPEAYVENLTFFYVIIPYTPSKERNTLLATFRL